MRHRLLFASASLALLLAGSVTAAPLLTQTAPTTTAVLQLTHETGFNAALQTPMASSFGSTAEVPICGVTVPTCYCKHC